MNQADVSRIHERFDQLLEYRRQDTVKIAQIETNVENLKSKVSEIRTDLPKQPCTEAKKVDKIRSDVDTLRETQAKCVSSRTEVGIAKYKTHALVLCCLITSAATVIAKIWPA